MMFSYNANNHFCYCDIDNCEINCHSIGCYWNYCIKTI